MDTTVKLELKKEAQQRLLDNPQDPVHNITHHYRTWLIGKELVNEEKLTDKIDLDILELTCWWHDVHIIENDLNDGERVVDVTANYVLNNFPKPINSIASSAIKTHEFGSKPLNDLGRVLQDADKLEIISSERLNDAFEAVKADLWTKDHTLKLINSIREFWLPNMPEKYHFNYSRNLHIKKLDSFMDQLLDLETKIKSI